MDREQARQEVRSSISCTRFLTPSKNGLYCCPLCGSGTGNHGTGAVKLYKESNTWYCHSCQNEQLQGKQGDIIDLYQQETGTDYNTALSSLADEIGITIDPYKPTAAEDFAESPQRHENEQGHINAPSKDKTQPQGTERPADYLAYFAECRQRIREPQAAAYLQSRGISTDTAAAYWIGFDPAADPASAPGGQGEKRHPVPRLIIPTCKSHYVGRRIDGQTEFDKINVKGSSPGIFNKDALYKQDVQEVFIVEGAFDALSLLEAGQAAIALNSAGNFAALLKMLEEKRTAATLILCPDNDKDPQTAAKVKKQFASLAAGLQRLNIGHITADINGSYKDANEHLQSDKASFLKAIEKAQRQTAAKPDNTQYYIDAMMQGEIDRFKNDKKTGFSNLDREAGGLYSGLYVLAAISSLGKTSFALQLADQLAESGEDVLFFSLEQSRLELVSKSLARRTVTRDSAGLPHFDNALTSLQIRKGAPAKQAAADYKKAIGDRVSIIEGNFACNISFIGDYVRQYIRKNGSRPVVFIDYLQILQPAEDVKKQSTKETIDNTITELKRISRELDLTVIAVSSVNRANYLTPIDFESLKESGSIEYSCDVLWGLQLQCLNSDPIFEKESKLKEKRDIVRQAKAATPRKIELSCLKNRYGKSNYSCFFDYYPANDLFTEDAAALWQDAPLFEKIERL